MNHDTQQIIIIEGKKLNHNPSQSGTRYILRQKGIIFPTVVHTCASVTRHKSPHPVAHIITHTDVVDTGMPITYSFMLDAANYFVSSAALASRLSFNAFCVPWSAQRWLRRNYNQPGHYGQAYFRICSFEGGTSVGFGVFDTVSVSLTGLIVVLLLTWLWEREGTVWFFDFAISTVWWLWRWWWWGFWVWLVFEVRVGFGKFCVEEIRPIREGGDV